ncbi:hypothetical protein [Paenibacillus ginsengarvi]|nr:hypothetical protein [Paenibacillus ginsengarvi]
MIRELRDTDDFSRIRDLIKNSLRQMRNDQKTHYVSTPEHLRSQFFGEDRAAWAANRGFVSMHQERIVAFAGVYVSENSKNGLLSIGFESGYEEALQPLLDRCSEVTQAQGGQRIGRFITLDPGQIRNDEITFWERYGFRADPYFHALLKLEVDEWSAPEHLNIDGVHPANLAEITDIIRILNDDGEEYLADEFRETYSSLTPDHVFLTLKDPGSGAITGIAYYRVSKFKDQGNGKTYDGYGAWQTGIHFRPNARLDRHEKRRFIQAVIASMKQLDVIFASGRVSSRDYDCLLELFAEGFYFQGSVPSVQNRMSKRVSVH